MDRKNRKERGSKGKYYRKGRKIERESQQKFVITVLHFYLIMNEDFIVQHPVQIHLRLKSFLPETISVSAEA